MDELFIFGTGEHSRKIFQCAMLLGYKVKGFVDQKASSEKYLGLPVYLFTESFLKENKNNIFIAIGNGIVREKLQQQFLENQFYLINLIHPNAYVSIDVKMGKGIFVGAGAVIETGSIIEDGAIVDIGVIIDHDCSIAKFCHVRPGTVVQSKTKI
jgi:sugar O-acyltransferase (sialic acid O-acetyltransferase NeuD family)